MQITHNGHASQQSHTGSSTRSKDTSNMQMLEESNRKAHAAAGGQKAQNPHRVLNIYA